MSMGGGNSPSSQTVTQKTEIPQYQQDYAIENENVARDIAARPYPTYQGERNAPLNSTQQQGLDITKATANDPYYVNGAKQAADSAGGWLGQRYGQTAGYTPATATPYNGSAIADSYSNYYGQLTPSSVSPWMSPYVESALQPQIRDINRQSNTTQKGIDAGATAAGAFGDASYGVRSGENDRNTNQLISDTTGKGYSDAYDRAVSAAQNAFGQNAGQFNTEDAARRSATSINAGINRDNNAASLAATDENNRASLGAFNANAGQFNADRTGSLNAGSSLSSLVASAYGISEQQASDLLGAGKTEQGQTQKGLDTAYQDFLNEFEYPQEMLNLRLATQAGSPYNTTRLTTSPYSSSAQSIGALSTLFGLGGKVAA